MRLCRFGCSDSLTRWVAGLANVPRDTRQTGIACPHAQQCYSNMSCYCCWKYGERVDVVKAWHRSPAPCLWHYFLLPSWELKQARSKPESFFFFFPSTKPCFIFILTIPHVSDHMTSRLFRFQTVHSRIMVGTTRQQHTPFFLLCLFFLYMARARNTRDSTIPTPPSWGPTFSVAYLATVR